MLSYCLAAFQELMEHGFITWDNLASNKFIKKVILWLIFFLLFWIHEETFKPHYIEGQITQKNLANTLKNPIVILKIL